MGGEKKTFAGGGAHGDEKLARSHAGVPSNGVAEEDCRNLWLVVYESLIQSASLRAKTVGKRGEPIVSIYSETTLDSCLKAQRACELAEGPQGVHPSIKQRACELAEGPPRGSPRRGREGSVARRTQKARG